MARLVLLTVGLGGLAAAGRAEEAATGGVSGRVADVSSKLALAGARVSVVGTHLEAFTAQDGTYQLPNIPVGSAVVEVSYVGYPPKSQTVGIMAGQFTRVDWSFGDQVVTMGAVVIAGDVVGTARAINERRSATALTEVVASDAIGQMPDKNVAEALERVSGVDIYRDKGEGRFVEIRGLDPIYIGVSVNGIRASTSEKGTREVPLDTIGSNMISSMEINKVNTPDMEGDAMGGSVNVKTRTALDEEGTQAMVSGGGNYNHQQNRNPGWNLQGFYGDTFLNGRLGVFVGVAAEDRPFTDYSTPETTIWAQAKSPTDGQQHFIFGGEDFRHYDVERWRNAINGSVDFKIDDTSKVWFRYLGSFYTERDHQWLTTFPFYGTGNTIVSLTDTSATTIIPAKSLIKSEAQIVNNKDESSLVAGYEKIFGSWTNDLTTGYTIGKYTRPTVTIAFANTTATTMSYAFTDPYHDNVTQLAGPSIADPASYAFSTKSAFSQTAANMHELTARDDLKHDFDVGGLPAYLKVGAEIRDKHNDESTFKEAITSIPFTLAGNIEGDNQDVMGSFPNFRILPQAVQNFYQNQAAYGQSPTASTTYGGAFQAQEDIGSFYGMGGITFGPLKLLAGARLEMTHFWIQGWQYDSTTTVVTPVVATHNYADVLPSVVLTYEIDPKTIARASWTYNLSRPDYSDTVPGRTVDDVNHVVSQGNPKIDALESINWDGSLEHYFSPLGVISGAVFYKQITNFAYQAQSGIDPSTGYLLTTYYTAPSAWIAGLEVTWSQRFSFLPEPLDGLGIIANATVGESQVNYPTRPGEDLTFIGLSKKFGNVALTYDKMGLHLQLAANYHGPRLEVDSVIGTTAAQDQYEDSYVTIDFGSTYSFARHWQVYLNMANLNNAPLREYFGSSDTFKRLQTYESYGWSATSGVRWTY